MERCRWKECSKPQPPCIRFGKTMSQQEKRRRETTRVDRVNAPGMKDPKFPRLQTTNKGQAMEWQDAGSSFATLELNGEAA